jgi:hypothetical protein
MLLLVSSAALWSCMQLPDDGGSDQSLAGAAHAADHYNPNIARNCGGGGEASTSCSTDGHDGADGHDEHCCSGTCGPTIDPDPESSQSEGIVCREGECDSSDNGTYCSWDGNYIITCADQRLTSQDPNNPEVLGMKCDHGCDESTGNPICLDQ